ncbi:ferredoxin [Amycolatopsis acidicola]|uniref:Ferredoxin n=1 Tax=Amycolatopsis acidicola TaxID=2596893 RepID=A0A5N0VDA1_9PSEU|nr:ferredoxin [Amycolatopsis acidicola]KAA9164045.1 ferredoxin [Amycolatopsis acidicola]
MRATVDQERCVGHALCAARAPEVYELDDLGYNVTKSTEVPANLEEQARFGAQACPEIAIQLHD